MPSRNSELARRVLDALSRGDAEGFGALAHPGIEIHTARGVRRGREEAVAWAARGYEHLQRRYVIDELRESGERVVALARVQYVWRESGEVADESLVAIVLDLESGKLRRWRLFDDPIEALDAPQE